GQYHYLHLGKELPSLILVGISYGATRFRDGNMRSTDFTAPADDRDFWGGAGEFQAVLREELIPLVESRYRADPERRVLFGQSLGGQFVLYTALTEPELFHGRIASNPALHRNLDFFLEWRGSRPAPEGASRLFVASGALDAPRFREPALAWRDHWATRERPWTLEFRTLEGQTHFSAAAEAFTQGMKWLLAPPVSGD
ncbi:MAG: alpha/beta hydrolase-fold protein, partial [Gammaproteobacteria bacterium]